MLISWIVLAIGHLSAASLPVIDVTAAASRRIATHVVPGEPSTLVEGLIAAALIAVYLLFARDKRGRRSVQRTAKPGNTGTGRKAA